MTGRRGFVPRSPAEWELGRKGKKLDAKPCGACGRASERLIRSKLGEGQWRLLCDECWVRLARDHPEYVYGGEWRARKRR